MIILGTDIPLTAALAVLALFFTLLLFFLSQWGWANTIEELSWWLHVYAMRTMERHRQAGKEMKRRRRGGVASLKVVAIQTFPARIEETRNA